MISCVVFTTMLNCGVGWGKPVHPNISESNPTKMLSVVANSMYVFRNIFVACVGVRRLPQPTFVHLNRFFQCVGFVGFFPGEIGKLATKVTISCRLAINRAF